MSVGVVGNSTPTAFVVLATTDDDGYWLADDSGAPAGCSDCKFIATACSICSWQQRIQSCKSHNHCSLSLTHNTIEHTFMQQQTVNLLSLNPNRQWLVSLIIWSHLSSQVLYPPAYPSTLPIPAADWKKLVTIPHHYWYWGQTSYGKTAQHCSTFSICEERSEIL